MTTKEAAKKLGTLQGLAMRADIDRVAEILSKITSLNRGVISLLGEPNNDSHALAVAKENDRLMNELYAELVWGNEG